MRGLRLSNISGALLLREKRLSHSIAMERKSRNKLCTQLMEQAAHKGMSHYTFQEMSKIFDCNPIGFALLGPSCLCYFADHQVCGPADLRCCKPEALQWPFPRNAAWSQK